MTCHGSFDALRFARNALLTIRHCAIGALCFCWNHVLTTHPGMLVALLVARTHLLVTHNVVLFLQRTLLSTRQALLREPCGKVSLSRHLHGKDTVLLFASNAAQMSYASAACCSNVQYFRTKNHYQKNTLFSAASARASSVQLSLLPLRAVAASTTHLLSEDMT